MSSPGLIISVFPDLGKYNNMVLPKGSHSLYLNFYRNKIGYPENYLKAIERLRQYHRFVFVSCNPAIRKHVCKRFPDTVFLYRKEDEATYRKTMDHIGLVRKQGKDIYADKLRHNWKRWHDNCKKYCERYNHRYYEYSSQDEFFEILNQLSKENNELPN